MHKLKPIRRQRRKIGRNEICPCGRGLIKYKRCCGKIENQRMMAAVQRHISRTIYDVVHAPKRMGKLRKIINLFKRGKNEGTGKF